MPNSRTDNERKSTGPSPSYPVSISSPFKAGANSASVRFKSASAAPAGLTLGFSENKPPLYVGTLQSGLPALTARHILQTASHKDVDPPLSALEASALEMSSLRTVSPESLWLASSLRDAPPRSPVSRRSTRRHAICFKECS